MMIATRRIATLTALLLALGPGSSRAGDGLVALQSADPACGDDSENRFVSCSNGTVTDNQSGLIWMANADCWGEMDWYEAMAAVAGLADVGQHHSSCGLSDGSSPGEWRLPTKTELGALFYSTCPSIPDDAGTGCWSTGCYLMLECSFYNVASDWYWTSTTQAPDPQRAWAIIAGGFGQFDKRGNGFRVWPVRGGQ